MTYLISFNTRITLKLDKNNEWHVLMILIALTKLKSVKFKQHRVSSDTGGPKLPSCISNQCTLTVACEVQDLQVSKMESPAIDS